MLTRLQGHKAQNHGNSSLVSRFLTRLLGDPHPRKRTPPYIWRTIRHFFQIFTDHFLSQKFFRFLKTLDTVSLPCFVSLIPSPCLLPEALVVKIIRILAKFRFDFSSHFMCFSQFVHFFLLYSLCFYRCFDPWFG